MSRHSIGRTKKIFKTAALLAMALTLVVSAVGYAWFDSIERAVRKNSKSLDTARPFLRRPEKKDLGEPINIVVLGSDKRYNEKGDTGRSDTLMVVRVNFEKKKVYIISIPRDTRVRIPGRGMDKINAAYAYGGPRLSIRTVEAFTGMELNHYVEVDFRGFKTMVDALGGVEVNVKETINNRMRGYTMYIPKGAQRMNGTLALNYVRYRHGDSDFKRAERQQNFFKALTENTLRLGSLWKIPRMIGILSDNVVTDFSMGEMRDLSGFLRSVKDENIESITVPGKSGMQNGVSYVFPDEEGLSRVVDAVEKGRSLKKLKSEFESGKIAVDKSVRVSLLNGSGVNGMALKAKSKLSGGNFKVLSVGTAPNANYLITEITVNPANRNKAQIVKDALLKTAIIKISSEKLAADVQVIIGKDYISKAGQGR